MDLDRIERGVRCLQLELPYEVYRDSLWPVLDLIKRMRQQNEALKLTERTLAFIPDEAIPKDLHAGVRLLKLKITAALADTADPKPHTGE